MSERRMAENEVIFRDENKKVQKGFNAVNKIATEENEPHLKLKDDQLLHFYCECSDNSCRQRIKVSLQTYNKVHESPYHFMIISGHDVAKIEDVILKEADYWVVKKHQAPPSHADKLNDIDIRNA